MHVLCIFEPLCCYLRPKLTALGFKNTDMGCKIQLREHKDQSKCSSYKVLKLWPFKEKPSAYFMQFQALLV